MWHVPLLDLHGGRILGHMGNMAHEQWDTWAIGHMSIRGRVMGYMGDGNRSDGHMVDRAHCHNNA